MNAEKFSFYIKNPAHLYKITYSELKSLVLQYPYCQNLRYLLLKKSILEKHQELDQNLQLAATYSNDRNLLYQQIKNGESYLSEADNFVLKEEYIELKDLGSESNKDKTELASSLSENQTEELIPKSSEDLTMPSILDEKTEAASILPNPSDRIEQSEQETETETIPEPIETPKEDKPLEVLKDIEEEEFDDITPDFTELFEAQLDDIEIVSLQGESEETQDDESEETQNEELGDTLEEEEKEEEDDDDAISIEDLILLDSLSPMERMEISKSSDKDKKDKDKDKDKDTKKVKKQEKQTKKKEYTFGAMDKLIEQTKKDTEIEPAKKESNDLTKEQKNKSTSKGTFDNWLKKMQPEETIKSAEETFEQAKSKKQKTKKKKKSKSSSKTAKSKSSGEKKKQKGSKSTDAPEVVAEKSLKENTEIVSETLAFLLVKQEKFKKAIKMYEKLSLIFPEKSGFFAEQIKKLKNL